MLEESSQNNRGATAVAENPQHDKAPWEQFQRPRESASATGRPSRKQQKGAWQQVSHFRVEFGPSRKDILNFTNQLAVMVRAGISLQDSLESIAEQNDNQKFRVIIIDLKNRIEAGQSFSQALAEHPQTFSNLYINMVAAAEISGSLSGMLQKLAEYLDSEAETRSQIKGAMVYPIIIAVMAVSVTIFLLCFVLPRFTAIFAGKEHLLPTPTKVLMASSAFLRGFWFRPEVVGQDKIVAAPYQIALPESVYHQEYAHNERAYKSGCADLEHNFDHSPNCRKRSL